MRLSVFCILLSSIALSVSANDHPEALTVDRAVTNDMQFVFPNDRAVKPKSGSFELVNYVLMSNEVGERYAIATLKNTSTGSRILDQAHILATFANGSRGNPYEMKLNFEGSETQSVTINFGLSKFPILFLETELN